MYDSDLVDRLRALLSGEPDVVEKRMFGGLAFLVGGHMAVSASGRGDLLLRVGPGQRDALTKDSRASPFEMRGRVMKGWWQVNVDDSVSDEELSHWVDDGVAVARSLPPR